MAAAYPQASDAGSIIGIAGTDAPLLPHQCMALARRLPLGVGRTRTTVSHFSGAAVQATEESIVNALVVNQEMTGRRGHRSPALPVDRQLELLRRRGVV